MPVQGEEFPIAESPEKAYVISRYLQRSDQVEGGLKLVLQYMLPDCRHSEAIHILDNVDEIDPSYLKLLEYDPIPDEPQRYMGELLPAEFWPPRLVEFMRNNNTFTGPLA